MVVSSLWFRRASHVRSRVVLTALLCAHALCYAMPAVLNTNAHCLPLLTICACAWYAIRANGVIAA
eukprot:2469211-Rhodomonas_salina.7